MIEYIIVFLNRLFTNLSASLLTMTSAITTLSPTAVWQYFYQITQIPRPSFHEQGIQDFIQQFGLSLKLETQKDAVGNIIIKKPATVGYENRRGVILQSHLDMVPQANSDSQHNFQTDPIETLIDGDWVTANGTTLGADNGIGVAASMAVLAATDIAHGPLEALFTSTEETGMVGALNLAPDVLSGDILLNLDSEDEKELYIGCAGGVDAVCTLAITRQALTPAYQPYLIELTGLKGGHSGIDIIKQRGNANKLLGRLLKQLDTLCDYQLIDFSGGNLRNALPREAWATLAFLPKHQTKVTAHITSFLDQLAIEYQGIEPNINCCLKPFGQTTKTALSKQDKQTVIQLISACPNGVHRMSIDMPDLVETSNNLAVINSEETRVVFECLLRSSVDSARNELADQLQAVFELAKAEVTFSGAYPGWQPNSQSTILKVMTKTGQQLFGKTPKQRGIHAGLECGILGGIYPHWEMISFGPTIVAPHSPDEKVHIESVDTFYNWLLLTLTAIPEKPSA